MNEWRVTTINPAGGGKTGEIVGVRSFSADDPLNENGTWSLELDLTARNKDALISLLGARATVAISARFQDGWYRIGGGQVDKLKPSFSDQSLSASGGGWLTPLAKHIIVNGEISDLITTPSTTERGFNNHESDGSGGFNTSYPADNYPYTFTWTSPSTLLEYIYIGHYAPFDEWNITLSQFNTNSANLNLEYFQLRADGSVGWEILTYSDGTSVGGVTMAQSGVLDWTIPSDWTVTPHDGKERYWIRCFVTSDLTPITVTNSTQRIKGADQFDIGNLIANYFPAGWDFATTSRQATDRGSFWPRIHSVSALRQLVEMAERNGEFFRGGDILVDDPRRIDYFRAGDKSSPMIAMSGDPSAIMEADNRAWIESVEYDYDSSKVVNDLYVEGAGQGVAALTLAQATDTYIGWTVDTANSRVTTALPVDLSAEFRKFSEIRSESGQPTEAAANELLAAAIAELEQTENPVENVTLQLRGLSHPLRAGDVFTVQYAHHHDGERTFGFDGEYTAQSVSWNGDENGLVATVNATTVPQSAVRDPLLRQIEETAALMRGVQPMDSSDVQRLGRTA